MSRILYPSPAYAEYEEFSDDLEEAREHIWSAIGILEAIPIDVSGWDGLARRLEKIYDQIADKTGCNIDHGE